jgi:hypothetical protein
MPPFVPRTRQEVEIDHQLREVAAKRRSARMLLGETMAVLAALDLEEDSLLALRSAESARRR